ncbi:MAG: hypothetical protein AB7S26_23415 [Sandaracinaceae bacterium]
MSGELRRAALARVKSMRSPRAAEVLRRAELEVLEREAGDWESSDGTVHGVDLRALVDGYALGLISSSPSVHDAVIEAITAVAHDVIGASVIDLRFEWGLTERPLASAYRDQPRRRLDRTDADHVRTALAAFVHASGDEALAKRIADATLTVSRGRVRIAEVPPEVVRDPLAALFGRPIRVAAS